MIPKKKTRVTPKLKVMVVVQFAHGLQSSIWTIRIHSAWYSTQLLEIWPWYELSQKLSCVQPGFRAEELNIRKSYSNRPRFFCHERFSHWSIQPHNCQMFRFWSQQAVGKVWFKYVRIASTSLRFQSVSVWLCRLFFFPGFVNVCE